MPEPLPLDPDTRVNVIEAALRAEDYIDIGNHPGEEETYRELAQKIVAAIDEDESHQDFLSLPEEQE